MCATSMITDYYQQRWPTPITPSVFTSPQVFPPGITITAKEWDEYQTLKRKAEEYDRRTNQPDCVKPGLAEWESAIETVLRKNGLIA